VVMEDPNMTMEEYIRLETKKAFKKGKYYDWETATYVYEDAPTFEADALPKSTISPNHANETDFDFEISFAESDDEDYTFMYD
ncbi:hypothetical protein Tco_0666625, partial [Tanacetum coccineum]